MQLAFAAPRSAPPELSLQLGLAVDRFLQAARAKGLAISDSDRGVLGCLMGAAHDAKDRLATLGRRIMLLEALSLTDEHTGLLNRRGFERELRRLLAQARRHEEGGVIALVDLDDFRSIGDVYGEAGTDAVLAATGRALGALVRQTDVVARLDADRFAIALARCASGGAIARLAEIERALNALSVPFAGREITPGATLGVTCYDGTDQFDGLLERLDTAMTMRRRRPSTRRSQVLPVERGSAAE
jgi:diguanylate cyclase (GGDEF)-like protein